MLALSQRVYKMYYYFAQFSPDEENPETYSVHFPDFPGCITCGDSLEEAMTMAMEALTGYIESEIEDGVDLPAPSDYETAKAKSVEYYRELEIPPHPGTLYLLVPADPKLEPFVRLNISMQPRLLAKVDRKAKSEGMTRSGFLATAAQNYINQLDAM